MDRGKTIKPAELSALVTQSAIDLEAIASALDANELTHPAVASALERNAAMLLRNALEFQSSCAFILSTPCAGIADFEAPAKDANVTAARETFSSLRKHARFPDGRMIQVPVGWEDFLPPSWTGFCAPDRLPL